MVGIRFPPSEEYPKETFIDSCLSDVTFATDDMTKISMHKEMKTLDDLKAGQPVKVKFHERDGKPVAVEIVVMSGKKTK